MKNDIRSYSALLTYNINTGMFEAPNMLSKLSYPHSGYDTCFQLEDSSFWFRHRNNCIVSAVNSFPPSGPIFDIGGGNGLVTKALQEAGFDAWLVEPSKKACENAVCRKVENIICASVQDADFFNDSLHAVGLFDVLEHIKDEREFLQRLRRALKNKGIIYISVPAYNLLWSEIDVKGGHFRRYNERTLTQLLAFQGFEVIFSTYLFSFQFLPLLFLRAIPFHLKSGQLIKNPQRAHVPPKAISKLVNLLCSYELSKLNKGGVIPFGSSCFIVARKKI